MSFMMTSTVLLKECSCGWVGGLRESKKHEQQCHGSTIRDQSYEYTIPETAVNIASATFEDSYSATTVGSNQPREIAAVFARAPVHIIQSIVHSTPVEAVNIMYDSFVNRHTSNGSPLRNFVRRNGKIYEVVAEYSPNGECVKRVVEHPTSKQTWEYITLKLLEWTSHVAMYSTLFPFLSEDAGIELRRRWSTCPVTGIDGDMADTAEYCIRFNKLDQHLLPLRKKLRNTLPLASDVFSPIRVSDGEKITLCEKTSNSIILWMCTACGYKNTCKTSTRSHVRNCIKKKDTAALHAVRVILDRPVATVTAERAFSEPQYLETHFRVTESLKRAQYAVHKLSPILLKYILDNETTPQSLITRGFEQFFGKAAPRTLQSIFRFNQHTVCLCVPKGVGTQEKKLDVVTGSHMTYTLFTRISKAVVDTLLIIKDLDTSWTGPVDTALERLQSSAYDDVTWNDLIHSVDVTLFRHPHPIIKTCLDDIFEHMATLTDASKSTRRVV